MKLTAESLNFARKHIEKYYDSDFFPSLDIYNNIWRVWEQVVTYFINTEIEELDITAPKSFAAPKPNGGFRIVHQLEPFNQLCYTAMAYLVSDKIENARVEKNKKIACSYRIKITEDGDFFDSSNGYEEFRDQSLYLADSNTFCLVTDITDFYNQIYVHRLQNAIENADSSLIELSKNIENFILNLNNGSSKGIPVGPAASIIFSEAIMMDIDQFIIDNGFEFTRYVDDIRIFGDNQIELKILLQKLTEYLYENHRLSLSSAKTKIMTKEIFLLEEVENPSNIEKMEMHEQLKLLNFTEDGVVSASNIVEPIQSIEELQPEERLRLQTSALKELMNSLVDKQKIDLGLTRHVLRKSKSLRSRSIYSIVLQHIDFLSPAMRDVILYLTKVTNNESFLRNIELFKSIITNTESIKFPYTKFWINWFITEHDYIYNDPFFYDYIKTQERFWRVKIESEKDNTSYIRSLKIEYDNVGIWERFYILRALIILPQGERRAFLSAHQRGIKKSEEFVVRAVSM